MMQELQTAQRYQRFLLVRAGGMSYAVPVSQVRHLVRGLTCYPVPGSSPRLLGLAQFGGEPLAVLDLPALAEGGQARSGHWVTVVLGRSGRDSWPAIGLAVDDALRVEALDWDEPGTGQRRLVSGVVRMGGIEVKVLDASLLMADAWPVGGQADG